MKKKILAILAVIVIAGLSAYAASPQEACPICMGSINKSLHVDYNGKRIFFGCTGCPEKFMESPDKYMDEIIDFEETNMDDAEIGIVTYGSSARSSKNALLKARDEGIRT